ncbi:MAG: phosphatase PAP2 family protein [Deltaproteobacteria bacterium]|nr:phosphatase PAP2 family protein [Deltaproteobacteria bacterium]
MSKAVCLFVLLGFTAPPGAADPSVYRLSPAEDGAIITAGLLSTIVLFACLGVNRRCPCDPDEVNGFDRGAIGNNSAAARALSDGLVGVIGVAPFVLSWMETGAGRELWEDAVVMIEIMAVNSGLNTLTKYAIQRPTPLAYSGPSAQIDDGYRSFYSGHTSFAFSALMGLSMTAYYHGHRGPWPWIASFGLGTVVGLARIAGGNHFPTDVIAGAIVGSAVGIAVPWAHAHGSKEVTIAALPGGLQVSLSF